MYVRPLGGLGSLGEIRGTFFLFFLREAIHREEEKDKEKNKNNNIQFLTMIDPMANLGNEGFDPNSAIGEGDSLLSGGRNHHIMNIHAIHLNNKKIDKVRSLMGIISGCVAGICGLTGLQGLGTSQCFVSFLPKHHQIA